MQNHSKVTKLIKFNKINQKRQIESKVTKLTKSGKINQINQKSTKEINNVTGSLQMSHQHEKRFHR